MKRNMISSAMGVSFLLEDKVLGLMKSEILMIDLLAVAISSIEQYRHRLGPTITY